MGQVPRRPDKPLEPISPRQSSAPTVVVKTGPRQRDTPAGWAPYEASLHITAPAALSTGLLPLTHMTCFRGSRQCSTHSYLCVGALDVSGVVRGVAPAEQAATLGTPPGTHPVLVLVVDTSAGHGAMRAAARSYGGRPVILRGEEVVVRVQAAREQLRRRVGMRASKETVGGDEDRITTTLPWKKTPMRASKAKQTRQGKRGDVCHEPTSPTSR